MDGHSGQHDGPGGYTGHTGHSMGLFNAGGGHGFISAFVVMVAAGLIGGGGHSDSGGHDLGVTDFDTHGNTSHGANSGAIDSRRSEPMIRQLLATAKALSPKAARIIWAIRVSWAFSILDWFANEGAPESGLLLSDNHAQNTTKTDYRQVPGVLLGTFLDSDDPRPEIQRDRPLSADFEDAFGDTETWVFQFLLGERDQDGVTKKVRQGHAGIMQYARVPVKGTKVRLIVYVRRFTIFINGLPDCEFLVWAELLELAGCTSAEVEEICKRANVMLDKLQQKLAHTPADFATRQAREALPHMGIRSLSPTTPEPVMVSHTTPAGNATSTPGDNARRGTGIFPRHGTLPS